MNKPMTPSWDLVKPSAQLVREHFLAFTYLLLLPGLLYLLGSILLGNPIDASGSFTLDTDPRQQTGLLLLIVASLWTAVNIGPTIYFELQATKGKSESVGDYYRHGLKYTLPLVGLYLMAGLLIVFGLFLFIVPGLILIRRYLLAPYYLVDDNLGIMAALKASATESKPVSKAIWGVIGVQLACTFAAAMVQVIPVVGIILGQVLAYAITFIIVLRYREVRKFKPLPAKK